MQAGSRFTTRDIVIATTTSVLPLPLSQPSATASVAGPMTLNLTLDRSAKEVSN